MKLTHAFVVLAAVPVLAGVAGCGGDVTKMIAPDGEASLGVTTSVTVTCPTPITIGNGGQCTAYGWDSNGQFTSSNASAWSSANTAKITVTSGGVISGVATTNGVNISATIDGVTGSKSVKVQPDIYFDYPVNSSVRAGHVCSYFAGVASGASPYTYSWSSSSNWVHDTGYTDNEPWTWTGHSTSGTSFTIYLTVTDANGVSASTSLLVPISSTAPNPCYI
jgi:hypothetical protein